MNTRYLFGVLIFIFFGASLSYAIQPSIKLDYNIDQKILHIDVGHVTTNVRDHFIRRIEVYKNDEEIVKMNFASQKVKGQIEDISLDAKEKDIIRVKAFCNESGPKEETLVVPEAPKDTHEDQKESADKITDQSTNENTDEK